MVKLQLTELPAASVAVQTTVLVPMGKALPEGGVHTVVTPWPVATGANVTVAVTLPGSGWVTMLLGQVMVGGAATVMVKLPLTELPAASVAVQTTVLVPMGKALPEGGVHTVVTQLPVATGANVTVAVTLPGSGWVTMFLGQVIVGGAPTTVMVKLQLTELLAVSVAMQTTVLVPMGKALPEGGVHTVVMPQLPVATGTNVTVAVHLPGSGCVTMLLGQVIFGG